MIFVLPTGEYDDDFLKGLASAVHFKLIDPAEIDKLFKRKLSHPQIAEAVLKIVKANIRKRNG